MPLFVISSRSEVPAWSIMCTLLMLWLRNMNYDWTFCSGWEALNHTLVVQYTLHDEWLTPNCFGLAQLTLAKLPKLSWTNLARSLEKMPLHKHFEWGCLVYKLLCVSLHLWQHWVFLSSCYPPFQILSRLAFRCPVKAMSALLMHCFKKEVFHHRRALQSH